jgi:hypothetical protein
VSLKARFFDAFASRLRPLPSQILRPTVARDGDHLRELLTAKTPAELSVDEIRSVVGGNLWMLGPEAFRYFLPSFLNAAIESYSSLSVFAYELVGALTDLSRADVVEVLDQLDTIPPGIGLPAATAELLRRQQLEWFDSGTPTSMFHDRVDSLTAAEGAAILDFFVALREAHGADFPSGELEKAVERYWGRYRAS